MYTAATITVATWMFIFLVNTLLDIVYAKYTMAVQRRDASHAAHWATAIILIGGVSIISYTHNPILILPAAAGAWVGTWYTVGKAKHDEGSRS